MSRCWARCCPTDFLKDKTSCPSRSGCDEVLNPKGLASPCIPTVGSAVLGPLSLGIFESVFWLLPRGQLKFWLGFGDSITSFRENWLSLNDREHSVGCFLNISQQCFLFRLYRSYKLFVDFLTLSSDLWFFTVIEEHCWFLCIEVVFLTWQPCLFLAFS